jgi:hypothetical protein
MDFLSPIGEVVSGMVGVLVAVLFLALIGGAIGISVYWWRKLR